MGIENPLTLSSDGTASAGREKPCSCSRFLRSASALGPKPFRPVRALSPLSRAANTSATVLIPAPSNTSLKRMGSPISVMGRSGEGCSSGWLSDAGSCTESPCARYSCYIPAECSNDAGRCENDGHSSKAGLWATVPAIGYALARPSLCITLAGVARRVRRHCRRPQRLKALNGLRRWLSAIAHLRNS